LQALFDDTLSSHLIVVYTHGGEVEGGYRGPAQASAAVARTIQAEGERHPDLQQLFTECGQRVVVLDNKAADRDTQVHALTTSRLGIPVGGLRRGEVVLREGGRGL
jgi:phage replication-related protein YjqB (UPF0714/DUF867 family)